MITEVSKLKDLEMKQAERCLFISKIIEKIGPILAINNKEIPNHHVVKKLIKNCPKTFKYKSQRIIFRHKKT